MNDTGVERDVSRLAITSRRSVPKIADLVAFAKKDMSARQMRREVLV